MGLCLCSELDHPGLARLVAAHARPPNYLMFFDFFEPPNLADKIHVEEWNPSVQQVVTIATDLGPNLLQSSFLLLFERLNRVMCLFLFYIRIRHKTWLPSNRECCCFRTHLDMFDSIVSWQFPTCFKQLSNFLTPVSLLSLTRWFLVIVSYVFWTLLTCEFWPTWTFSISQYNFNIIYCV